MRKWVIAGLLAGVAGVALAGGMFPGLPSSGSSLTGNEIIPADTQLSGGRYPQTQGISTGDLRTWLSGAFTTLNATATDLGTDTAVHSAFDLTTNVNPASTSSAIVSGLWVKNNFNGPADLTGGVGHMPTILGWYENTGSATATLGIGVEGKCLQTGSGYTVNCVALEANIVGQAGTIGNAIGVQSHMGAVATGTVAHLIGYYFPDQSAYSVSDRAAVRSDDPGAKMIRKIGTGASALWGDMAVQIANAITPAATAGTGAEIICAGTIPANTLRANGDRIVVTTQFLNAATNNNKATGLKIGSGSDQIFSSAIGAASNNAVSVFSAQIKRTGASAQQIILEGRMGTTLISPVITLGTLDTTADITIAPLAQSAVAGEITCYGHDAVYFPATK